MKKIINNIKKHKELLFLFFFSLILRLLVVTLIDTPVTSDFKTMLEASLELVAGTSNYKEMPYFIFWGYQMGHVIYQALLLSITNQISILKISNAIITSLTVGMIFLLGKELTSKKAAFITSIIYSIFLSPLLLNTILTNQLLPMLFILVAIYLWIKYKKSYKIMLVIGFLLAISNILRSETIVIILALFLYSLFLVIKKDNRKRQIISFIIILISYCTITTTTSIILKTTNISPSGLENHNTAWKFLEGLNTETRGQYSSSDAEKYAYNEKKTKQKLKQRIQKDWTKYPILFAKKIKILWFNSDLSWQIDHIEDQEKITIYEGINQIFIYYFIIMSLLSIITIIKRNYKQEQILIYLILFVYFGVYLLIEVMPRYAYSLQIFESLLAMITLGYILENKQKEGEQHAPRK